MKAYAVTIPVAGSIIVFVDAETETEAIELALEKQDWRVIGGEGTEPGEEFSAMRSIGTGNVCHAPCREISVECDGEV